MATVRAVLWKQKRNARGQHPIWLRFADASRSVYAALGVYVAPGYWNPKAERVRKTHPLADEINTLIEARLADAERERLRLLTAREVVTAEALKNAVAGRGHSECFLEFARAFLDDVERQGNVQRVRVERAFLAKLEAFAGAPLPFRRLTPAFLDRFTAWMLTERKNKASSVQRGINVLRLHYNRAVRHGVVSGTDSPFLAYKPPKVERPERTRLTAAQVAAIEALDLGPRGPHGSSRAKARDLFLFSFYTRGTRFADVVQLRRRDVTREEGEGDGGAVYRLRYRMGKTRRRVAVLLVPQALAIIEPYLQRAGEPGGYLFDTLDGAMVDTPHGLNAALINTNRTTNRRLEEIAKAAGIEAPLTYHCARHSFADLARRSGWSVYDISKGLGHGGIAVTAGYLADLDAEALDERMRGLFSNGGGR
jgi:integrase/recombinase XerD